MNKREYLRSLGFEVGQRGRFSAEMLKALGEVDESIYTPPEDEEVQELHSSPLRTDGVRFYKATTTAGVVIKFDTCPNCKEVVVRCHCKHPPPEWLSDLDKWEDVSV